MRVFLALPTYDETIYINTMMTALNAVAQPSPIEVCLEPGSGSLLPRVFNRLLASAVARGYDRFAMLHSDIAAEPGWLDKMLRIMDERDADIVSVVAPIKDQRGMVSVATYDERDELRILTLDEIHDKLPETFDISDKWFAEIGAKILAVNTGLMLMRLDRPWLRKWSGFRIVSEIRWTDEQIHCHVVSEDWDMSRELSKLMLPPRIVATRAVRLHHRGFNVWPNIPIHRDTMARGVLPTKDIGPLSLVQILEFELGRECNLGQAHRTCPNRHAERYGTLDTSRELDDDTIIHCAVTAYTKLGFTGLIGWIYYNEPLLQQDRMFALMGRIKSAVPQVRFMLWTNGYLIPEQCGHYDQFEQIIISGYSDMSRRGLDRLNTKHIPVRWINNPRLDDRLLQVAPADANAACLRPFVEFIIDNYGNTHLCCYDWQGQGSWGNVFHDDMHTLALRWRKMLPDIAGVSMNGRAPDVCHRCGHRWSQYQTHCGEIVALARQWREGLTEA